MSRIASGGHKSKRGNISRRDFFLGGTFVKNREKNVGRQNSTRSASRRVFSPTRRNSRTCRRLPKLANPPKLAKRRENSPKKRSPKNEEPKLSEKRNFKDFNRKHGATKTGAQQRRDKNRRRDNSPKRRENSAARKLAGSRVAYLTARKYSLYNTRKPCYETAPSGSMIHASDASKPPRRKDNTWTLIHASYALKPPPRSDNIRPMISASHDTEPPPPADSIRSTIHAGRDTKPVPRVEYSHYDTRELRNKTASAA